MAGDGRGRPSSHLAVAHDTELILTLTGALTAALVFGLLTNRLRMSPIVGYLLAGIAVGPFTPGYVAHRGIALQFAEVGVVLLMFGVGLHFNLQDLLDVRRIAVRGAMAQIAVATALAVLVMRAAGLPLTSGVVYGLAISVASTVVLLRVLADHGALHTATGRVAVGWLIVEDLFTVIVLVLMPLLFAPRADAGVTDAAGTIAFALLKIGLFAALVLVGGARVIPWLLERVARTRSHELFTLTVLVLALGIAVASSALFGVSMALGAFLAGMVVGQSDFSARAGSDALPMRDAFAVLFFVSMGMLFDPAALKSGAGTTLAILGVVLIGKPLAALVVVLAMRQPVRLAVSVAIALAQIGEFSFIVGALGVQLGVLPQSAVQPLVAVAIVSITLNPLLFRYAEPAARLLERILPATTRERISLHDSGPGDRVIVVGHGPVGRTVSQLLREQGMQPVIIELNYDTVAALRSRGEAAVFGDAAHVDVLEAAGVRRAVALIFAASGSPATETVRAAKELNPNVLVLARTGYIRDVAAVRAVGASDVVAAEAEVAFAMTEHVLQQLGATGEQIERARVRVREALAASASGA